MPAQLAVTFPTALLWKQRTSTCAHAWSFIWVVQ